MHRTRPALRLALLLVSAALAACATPRAAGPSTGAAFAAPPASVAAPGVVPSTALAAASPLELLESWPAGTTLHHAGLRDAAAAWPLLFDSAKERIDLAQFYYSNEPGSPLEACVQALERAAARGVRVRVLAEEKFYSQYPETLERLARQKNFEVRRLDWKRAAGGGILHAKYFLIDANEAVLGSQNFDWRSLSQIQELGVRFRAPAAVGALQAVFDADWAAAAGEKLPAPALEAASRAPALEAAGASRIALVASPPHTLPAGVQWDLPAVVKLIDAATRTVRVQVLTYRPTGRGGEGFTQLDEALRRAAERGVAVSLLVSDWAMGKGSIDHLRALSLFGREQRLARRPGILVKVLVIPALEKCIPFARVAHAKYLVVDGAEAFVSTSNWERDYFFESRNVGLIISGGVVPAQVDAFFESTWRSGYAQEVTPEGTVPPVPNKSCGGGK